MKKEQDELVESEAKRIKLDDSVKDEDVALSSSKSDLIVENNVEESEPLSQCKVNLLDFSDDVLLIIFASLPPEDLLSVSETCIRLANLVQDKTLWEVVDFRSSVIPLKHLKRFIKFFQSSTKFIATRGPAISQGETIPNSMSQSFLRGVAKKCPNLATLILENHLFDSSKVKLEDFPSTLQHLVLKSCILTHMVQERSYFYGLDVLLPKLKSLDLTMCRWFVPHSLLALSKSKTLECLNLTGCDVSDCLPYASLAANFGFTTLKILDLSYTEVSDTEVICFNSCVLLQELILRSVDNEGDVTDVSITSYGGPPQTTLLRYNDALEVVRGRPPTRLSRLVVSGYLGISNTTLRHAASHMHLLRHLDVSGTSCTKTGLIDFTSARPEVNLVHSLGDLL